MVDLTRDGKPEKVSLRITGSSIREPFTWIIEIRSDGRRIFFKRKADTHLDKFFNDGFTADLCTDYESCKKKWYFDNMLSAFLAEPSPSLSEALQNKLLAVHTYDDLVKMIFQTGKASLDESRSIVESLKKDIESGTALGIVPEVNPFEGTGIYFWIPVIDDFVKVYDD